MTRMECVKLWNPKTGESKRVMSREKYDELMDKGWEVLEWPKSDKKY